MTTEQDLERGVRAWLVVGPDRLPGPYLDAALDEISRTRQRRPLLPAWRPFAMNPRLRLILVAAAAAIALIVGALSFLSSGHPTPTLGPRAPVTPAPTAVSIGRIAYVCLGDGKDDSEICTVNVDGTARVRLTNVAALDAQHPAFEAFPAWSPDRTQIAFVSARDSVDHWTLYLMRADGSNQAHLVTGTATAFGPTFSPDGRTIAFLGGNGVWTVNVDGSKVHQLTFDQTDDNPSYSPDGTQIVFTRKTTGHDRIFIMRADGSGATAVASSAAVDDADPTWSPDGRKVAFVRTGSDGVNQIAMLDVTNALGGLGEKAVTQITTGPLGGATPAWSPDGSQLVFGRTDGMYLMNADGSGIQKVNLLPADNGWAPDWG